MKPKQHIALRIGLLLLFFGYYGGLTLFPHVHEFEGQRIVHSHPYTAGNAASPGHQHTATGFHLIAFAASTLLLISSGYICVPLSNGQATRIFKPAIVFHLHCILLKQNGLRAPPAMIE